MATPIVLDPSRLQAAFPKKFGDLELVSLESSPSTNTDAFTRSGANRLLIWTPQQTAGRGRGTNQWESHVGCLTFTLLEPDPEIPEARLSPVSLIAAIAMADALPVGIAQLKWPNDVYARGRKLCGILVERHPSGALVVGIGLNITNDVSGIDIPAINLRDAAGDGAELDSTRILSVWLGQFLELLHLYREERLPLAEAWQPRCFLAGREVTMKDGVAGHCLGIAPDGGLRLRTKDGERLVHGGEVGGFSD